MIGKNILLGVSGSIAAYKTAALTRLFVKAGANVRIIMTESAKTFITPLTLATLSKNPVESEFVKSAAGEWTNHVELGLWADLFLIAPASANTLGKMANGICDNLLLATYLSARCPVWVAPAMDLDMFAHPSTSRNLKTLADFGNLIIEPESGELASGLEGKGRLAEPETIFQLVADWFKQKPVFAGKRVLITAGPTYEAIDPVRFIGNHSSGKMGFALAEAFANQGAEVVLISGPSQLSTNHPAIKTVRIVSAAEMLDQAKSHFPSADIAIMSAAVADYTPRVKATQKIKKSEDEFAIELVKTTDILKTLGTQKSNQFLVGFALETENELENAIKKLKAKNLDLIVLNSLNHEGAGFGYDTNRVTLIDKSNQITELPLQSKNDIANHLVQYISSHIHA